MQTGLPQTTSHLENEDARETGGQTSVQHLPFSLFPLRIHLPFLPSLLFPVERLVHMEQFSRVPYQIMAAMEIEQVTDAGTHQWWEESPGCRDTDGLSCRRLPSVLVKCAANW